MATTVYMISRYRRTNEVPNRSYAHTEYIGTTPTLEEAKDVVIMLGGGDLKKDSDHGSLRVDMYDRFTWDSAPFYVRELSVTNPASVVDGQTENLRASALAKLTPAERTALGL